MANMGYCRFRNTLSDLRDCYEAWEDDVSEEEAKARARLLEICQELVADFGDEDDD
jgi:hypothetical protein